MAINGILFDKDGTLIDFQSTWVPLYQEASLSVAGGCRQRAVKMLVASGYDEAKKRVLPNTVLAQGSNDEIAAAWLPYAPESARGVENLSEAIEKIFNARISSYAVPVTDLKKLFTALKNRNLKLGVATSDSADGARNTLEQFGVMGQLDFCAGFDSGFGPKPETGMVEGFASATNLAVSEIMVVGDSSHDMEMGRAAGVGKTVAVLTGPCSRQEFCDEADHIIDSIADLETLL